MDPTVNKVTVKQCYSIPDGLLEVTPDALETILSEPTLLHLQGTQTEPLFLSVLLHGNEPTGFLAVQRLLIKYQNRTLPRALSIFFGNVSAASQGLRRLDGQADYNRIWPGTQLVHCPETDMAEDIVNIMTKKPLFASIDIHNNTGLNPHYSCINKLEPQFLQLATLFGRFVVYFTSPKGVQSSAFAEYCPAVTLECGRPGHQYGVDHALEFIEGCLNLTALPEHTVHPQDIDLFHTVAQVCIQDGIDFSFHRQEAELLLNDDIETLNFTEIPAGTALGKVQGKNSLPLVAKNEAGHIITDYFFSNQNGYLALKRPTMPSMLTFDEKVIKQDCLCYLMERLAI
jgi:succinylglutamate desuccinylase